MSWGAAQFFGVREAATNVSVGRAEYTRDMFLADFPQFTDEKGESLAPAPMLGQFLRQASESVAPDKWLDKWRWACGLYTAHYLTLYLQAYCPHSDSAAQAAATGGLVGVVKSATLGDASVAYDTSALTAATEKWGGLNATRYGQLLATEARLVGMGGTVVL